MTERACTAPIPLVLDLDGTVIRTDTFHEMITALLIRKPFLLLQLPFWFLKGRAYTKARLVELVDLNLGQLPYNQSLLEFAKKEREKGRPLILATGTDQRLAQKISTTLGIFQETLGSDGKINLTGARKAQALLDRFGVLGFDYAGDSSIDAEIWKVARKAFVISPKWGVLKSAQALKGSEDLHYMPRAKRRSVALLLALRPWFWLPNLLSASLLFFVGLSLLSSGLLILGDLLNLERERQTLCGKSIFAQGHLHLLTAFILSPLLILLSFFFLVPEGILPIGGYIFVFLVLDRLTRCIFQPFRWAILYFFQMVAALFVEISALFS